MAGSLGVDHCRFVGRGPQIGTLFIPANVTYKGNLLRDRFANFQLLRVQPGCVFQFRHSFGGIEGDRKSTRLNSSHGYISYAVFCLKKKKKDAGVPVFQPVDIGSCRSLCAFAASLTLRARESTRLIAGAPFARPLAASGLCSRTQTR